MCKRTFTQDLLPEEEVLLLQGTSQAAKSEAGDLKEKHEIRLKLEQVANSHQEEERRE